jgi:hypothetical protein
MWLAPLIVKFIFLSENRPMADRVQQLINDISNMQRFVTDISIQMDKKDARIRPTMDKLMEEHGLNTFSELRDKALAQLDEETKEKFLKVYVTHHAKHNIYSHNFTYFSICLLACRKFKRCTRSLRNCMERLVINHSH